MISITNIIITATIKTMLSELTESQGYDNYYSGQNICAIRSIKLRDEFPLTKIKNNASLRQALFDIGCSLIDMNIVKDGELNPEFYDYLDWQSFADIHKDNCKFLHELGHPYF
jgi:hypothetical protein